MTHELIDHLRRDATIVDDPRAAALFETSAEVLARLEQAFEHYATRSDSVWQYVDS